MVVVPAAVSVHIRVRQAFMRGLIGLVDFDDQVASSCCATKDRCSSLQRNVSSYSPR